MQRINEPLSSPPLRGQQENEMNVVFHKNMYIKSKLPDTFAAGRARGHVELKEALRILNALNTRLDTNNEWVRDQIVEIVCSIDNLNERGLDAQTEFVYQEFLKITEDIE